MKSILTPFINLVTEYRASGRSSDIRIESILFKNDTILADVEDQLIQEDMKAIAESVEATRVTEDILSDVATMFSTSVVNEDPTMSEPLDIVMDPVDIETNQDDTNTNGGFPEEMENSDNTAVGGVEPTMSTGTGSTELLDPAVADSKDADEVAAAIDTSEPNNVDQPTADLDQVTTEGTDEDEDMADVEVSAEDEDEMLSISDEMPEDEFESEEDTMEESFTLSEEAIQELFALVGNAVSESDDRIAAGLLENMIDNLFQEDCEDMVDVPKDMEGVVSDADAEPIKDHADVEDDVATADSMVTSEDLDLLFTESTVCAECEKDPCECKTMPGDEITNEGADEVCDDCKKADCECDEEDESDDEEESKEDESDEKEESKEDESVDESTAVDVDMLFEEIIKKI